LLARIPFAGQKERIKVLSLQEEEESSRELVAPLLRSSNSISQEGLDDNEEGVPASQESVVMTYNSTSDHGMLRGISWRLVNVKTVADTLPNFLTMVLTNGKIAAAVLLAVYLVFVSLWLPFWLLSFLITEWGVYALTVGTIFLIGRAIIRLIAFPGASQKVTTEIEVEFAKYSVRMLTAAAGSVADVATLLAPIPEQDGQQVQLDSRASYELPMRWRRLKSYRDRVLGTYADVLQYFYQQESSSDPTAPELTKYCNNRLSGDVGDLMSLTVSRGVVSVLRSSRVTLDLTFCFVAACCFFQSKARLDGRELLNRLQNILGLLDVLEQTANSALESGRGSPTEEARATAKQLLDASNEFRDFVSSLKPPSADGDVEEGGTVEDPTDAVRRRIEEQNAATAMEAAKTGLASILPMLDPPPHTSIFGFDVQRGCMLSRYRGSRYEDGVIHGWSCQSFPLNSFFRLPVAQAALVPKAWGRND
jgi:hypothetical protein